MEGVRSSLTCRDRSVNGANAKVVAKQTLSTLLGVSGTNIYDVLLGSNATSLLSTLASQYAKQLTRGDEIVIRTENHWANVTPWIEVANEVGAVVKWWTTVLTATISNANLTSCSSSRLEDLVTKKTRVVAISHASNVLGEIRNIAEIASTVHRLSHNRAHTVVDGVAATPHVYANVEAAGVDWYVVSCHKLFGPHIGALCGTKDVISQVCGSTSPEKVFELGTLNYEACGGIGGLGSYFADLAKIHTDSLLLENSEPQQEEPCERNVGTSPKRPCDVFEAKFSKENLDEHHVRLAYQLIQKVETPQTEALLAGLKVPKVRILGTSDATSRLPVTL
mmetsp:Transcript_3069/g.5585  ORF Transcript_3069/g.5585 Transcript_3069/m.5585 type:complete len:336 (-) Transcript_3069:281-1288(-)